MPAVIIEEARLTLINGIIYQFFVQKINPCY